MSIIHVKLLPKPIELDSERVSAVDDLGACLIKLSAVVEDEHHVSLELVLARVHLTSDLGHYRANVHWVLNDTTVLFIGLIIPKSVQSDRIEEVCNFVVIVELSQDKPALLHVRVWKLLRCKWIVHGVFVATTILFTVIIVLLLLSILSIFHLSVIVSGKGSIDELLLAMGHLELPAILLVTKQIIIFINSLSRLYDNSIVVLITDSDQTP